MHIPSECKRLLFNFPYSFNEHQLSIVIEYFASHEDNDESNTVMWKHILSNQKVSEDFLEKYVDDPKYRFDLVVGNRFGYICEYTQISEEFLAKHPKLIHQDNITRDVMNRLSDNFIIENFDKYNLSSYNLSCSLLCNRSVEFLNKIQDKIDWKYVVYLNNDQLIKYKDKVKDHINLIICQAYYGDYGASSYTKGIPYISEDTIEKLAQEGYIDDMGWYTLCNQYPKMSDVFLENHWNDICSSVHKDDNLKSLLRLHKWYHNIIANHLDSFYDVDECILDMLIMYIPLSEDILGNILNKMRPNIERSINSNTISMLSENFIRKYQNELCWNDISKYCADLSDEFIEEFAVKNRINMFLYIIMHDNVSDKIKEQFADRMDVSDISNITLICNEDKKVWDRIPNSAIEYYYYEIINSPIILSFMLKAGRIGEDFIRKYMGSISKPDTDIEYDPDRYDDDDMMDNYDLVWSVILTDCRLSEEFIRECIHEDGTFLGIDKFYTKWYACQHIPKDLLNKFAFKQPNSVCYNRDLKTGFLFDHATTVKYLAIWDKDEEVSWDEFIDKFDGEFVKAIFDWLTTKNSKDCHNKEIDTLIGFLSE